MAQSGRKGLAFGIDTPADMLRKLQRELNRVAEASFIKQDLTDFGLNCALTAWHISDWVWQHRFKDDPEALKTLLSRYPKLLERSNEYGFKEYLTRQCPELALCQDIANGFKHVAAIPLNTRQAKGADDTTASATTALGLYGYVADGESYRLKISSPDGKSCDGVNAFNEVVRFWTQFMAEHGLL